MTPSPPQSRNNPSVVSDAKETASYLIAPAFDLRHFDAGWRIPSEHYCDQPYVVKTDDGAWLCAMTTGPGEEGQRGQRVISIRSTDQGRTWEEPVDLEPPDGPEAAYSVLFKAPSGRIYCFYNHNTDDLREVIADDPPFAGGKHTRVDCLGYFVFRYSDDHGRSWSAKRYVIPVRETEIDRSNPYGGKVRFFWNTGYAFSQSGKTYVPLHKVGQFGYGTYVRSEGVLLCSDNLLTESDPEKIRWETLPEGERGLRTPEGGGPVSEEQCFVPLGEGALFVIYRTTDGWPCHAYSRDGGRTWDPVEYATYGPGCRRIKHPRAAAFVWRCSNGKFFLWYHNNGTRDYNSGPAAGNRNIAWMCGGELKSDGFIHWTEPEIAVYCEGPLRGASYPNLVEEDGQYYLTATQKHCARTIALDPRVAEILHRDSDAPAELARTGLVLERDAAQCAAGRLVPAPELPSLMGTIDLYKRIETLENRGGFTIDLEVCFDSLTSGQVLLDSFDKDGRGISLTTVAGGVLRFSMSDGFHGVFWDCDAGLLQPGKHHCVTVIVDGGPKVIAYVIDGRLNDGGKERPFGYGRFNALFKAPNGSESLTIAPNLAGSLRSLRIYNRYLLVGEAVRNHWYLTNQEPIR